MFGIKELVDIELTQFHSLQQGNRKFTGPPMQIDRGYNVQLEVHPAGEGISKSTYLSVNIVSLKGDYDGSLTFPAHFLVRLEIMNTLNNTDHFTKELECFYEKPVSESSEEIGGDFEFIALEELYLNEEKKTQYLNNDTIRFRVSFHDICM